MMCPLFRLASSGIPSRVGACAGACVSTSCACRSNGQFDSRLPTRLWGPITTSQPGLSMFCRSMALRLMPVALHFRFGQLLLISVRIAFPPLRLLEVVFLLRHDFSPVVRDEHLKDLRPDGNMRSASCRLRFFHLGCRCSAISLA